MKKFHRIRSTIARPAVATAYAVGDEVSNSATASAVSRMTFDLTGLKNVRILSSHLEVTAASGNVVTTNLLFEVLLYRTDEVPAAVGDNVTNPLTSLERATAVGFFHYDDGGWWGPTGQAGAGGSQAQGVGAHMVQPTATPTLITLYPAGYIFNMDDVDTKSLTAVVRAMGAWTPGAIINTLGLTLHIEAE